MGTRRGHILVLLLVLGLVVVSAWSSPARRRSSASICRAVWSSSTRGSRPARDEVSGEDIEDSISIIEQRINKLGVSEPEVARLGTDQITVSCPASPTPARRRTGRHHRPALLLRLGAEPDRPARRRSAATRAAAAGSGAESLRKTLGRSGPQSPKNREQTADLRRRLPDRLRRGAARRRTGAGRKLPELLGREAALLPLRERTSRTT